MMRRLVLATLVLSSLLGGCTDTQDDDATPEGPLPVETMPPRPGADPVAALALPVWRIGDEWTYELEPQDWERLCETVPDAKRFVSRDLVVGDGIRHDLPDKPDIYRVRSYMKGCAGEPIGERDRDWIKTHLAVLDDEGRWEPKTLFPLEDGKRWEYRPEGGVDVQAEATHVPTYVWNGKSVEAWRIDLVSDLAKETFWFGAAAKNVLYRETYKKEEDAYEPFGTVLLRSYTLAS